MKEEYRQVFDQVHASERLREEVAQMTKLERRNPKKRFPKGILIAAAILAVLAGSAIATVGMPGTLPVLKHFPGYGSNADTHTGIAVDQRPMETFETSDLLPFKAGIEAGTPFVLVSHNIVNCMDPELPASLSPAVHKILREECGFDGIAITDDLAMDAVKAYAKDGAVAVLALQAGNDMVVTTDYRTQIPAVIAAVQEGTLEESVIDDACLRVLRCKDTFLGIPENNP